MRKFGILATHPIQYYAPWYRALAARPELDVVVYFAHRTNAADHAASGFAMGFDWDVPLLDGYRHAFLRNEARQPTPTRFLGCDAPSIRDEIRRERFDAFLVHGWGSKVYWQAMRACWSQRAPLMVRGDSQLSTPRSTLKKRLKQLIYPRFISRFDAYLCVGERARQYYLAYGADPRRMVFCPHFVDNDRFSAEAEQRRPERDAIRRAWGIPADALCVAFCGKFIAKKRPMDLVEAARIAGQSGAQRPVHLLFVGNGPLGDELRRATRVVYDAAGASGPSADAASSDRPAASFAGFLNQSEVSRAYVAADALALPSDGGETWGLVVNEAMACGLPAIVSDQVGCGPDLVQDGATGYVVPCGDAAALATKLVALANDAGLAARLGVGARKRVAGYSINAAAESAAAAVVRLAERRGA